MLPSGIIFTLQISLRFLKSRLRLTTLFTTGLRGVRTLIKRQIYNFGSTKTSALLARASTNIQAYMYSVVELHAAQLSTLYNIHVHYTDPQKPYFD